MEASIDKKADAVAKARAALVGNEGEGAVGVNSPPNPVERTIEVLGVEGQALLGANGVGSVKQFTSGMYTIRDSLQRGRITFSGVDPTKLQKLVDTATDVAQELFDKRNDRSATSILNSIKAFASHDLGIAQALDHSGRLDDGRSTENVVFGKVDLTTLRGGAAPPKESHREGGPD